MDFTNKTSLSESDFLLGANANGFFNIRQTRIFGNKTFSQITLENDTVTIDGDLGDQNLINTDTAIEGVLEIKITSKSFNTINIILWLKSTANLMYSIEESQTSQVNFISTQLQAGIYLIQISTLNNGSYHYSWGQLIKKWSKSS